MTIAYFTVITTLAVVASACSGDNTTSVEAAGLEAEVQTDMRAMSVNPDEAEVVEVDRFAEGVGSLFVRTNSNDLPATNAPVDFDVAPFITRGFGPDGKSAQYYNFDVQSELPAPIYVFFRDGEQSPVEGQLNVVDVIPGDAGYSDFWQVHRVVVPDNYVPNSITSFEDIVTAGLNFDPTETLVNCPVVPANSTARLRLGNEANGLSRGWYQGDIVNYFSFEESPLSGSQVPLAPIYVTFNINPGEDGGGPASGFVHETNSDQTHNVLEGLPGSEAYSPLWSVTPYDNTDFELVSDLVTAEAANVLARGVANVNCPVVGIEQ